MSRVNESEFIKYKEFVKFTVGYVRTLPTYLRTYNLKIRICLSA